MKRLKIIFIIFIGSLSVVAQTNYALFEIDEVEGLCFDKTGENIYVIEKEDYHPVLLLRKLCNGEIIKQYQLKLPDAQIGGMVMNTLNDQLYLTTQTTDENGKRVVDKVYSIDTEKATITELLDVTDKKIRSYKLSIVGDLLVLQSMKDVSWIYNVQTKSLKPLSTSRNFRLICTAPEHHGFIMGKINEAAERIEVQFMNANFEMTGTLGVFNPDLVLSTERSENKVPSIAISEPDYKWIESEYQKGSYPASIFEIAQNTELVDLKNQFDHNFEIVVILAVSSKYVIGGSINNAWIYNTQTPNLKRLTLISEEENKAILNFLKSRKQYSFKSIESDTIGRLCDARFVDVTVDEIINSTEKTTMTYNVAKKGTEIEVISDPNDVISYVKSEFSCKDSLSAIIIQDFLDLFYPITSYFDAKEKRFYQQQNNWIFVRGKSFGEAFGYIVACNKSGTITSIEYKTEIK